MNSFILETPHQTIRFKFYLDEAPVTCMAFAALLPFTRAFYHAQTSGNEIWIADAPPLDIIRENASVFTLPGEIVYGPLNPVSAKIANCVGIYYGDGKGLDACNIFAKVFDEDLELLKELGDDIWKNGVQDLTFEL